MTQVCELVLEDTQHFSVWLGFFTVTLQISNSTQARAVRRPKGYGCSTELTEPVMENAILISASQCIDEEIEAQRKKNPVHLSVPNPNHTQVEYLSLSWSVLVDQCDFSYIWTLSESPYIRKHLLGKHYGFNSVCLTGVFDYCLACSRKWEGNKSWH